MMVAFMSAQKVPINWIVYKIMIVLQERHVENSEKLIKIKHY